MAGGKGGLQEGTGRAGPAGLGQEAGGASKHEEARGGLGAGGQFWGGTISCPDKLFTSHWPPCRTWLPRSKHTLTCMVQCVGENGESLTPSRERHLSLGPQMCLKSSCPPRVTNVGASWHITCVGYSSKLLPSLLGPWLSGGEGGTDPAKGFWRPEAEHHGNQEAWPLGNRG